MAEGTPSGKCGVWFGGIIVSHQDITRGRGWDRVRVCVMQQAGKRHRWNSHPYRRIETTPIQEKVKIYPVLCVAIDLEHNLRYSAKKVPFQKIFKLIFFWGGFSVVRGVSLHSAADRLIHSLES